MPILPCCVALLAAVAFVWTLSENEILIKRWYILIPVLLLIYRPAVLASFSPSGLPLGLLLYACSILAPWIGAKLPLEPARDQPDRI